MKRETAEKLIRALSPYIEWDLTVPMIRLSRVEEVVQRQSILSQDEIDELLHECSYENERVQNRF